MLLCGVKHLTWFHFKAFLEIYLVNGKWDIKVVHWTTGRVPVVHCRLPKSNLTPLTVALGDSNDKILTETLCLLACTFHYIFFCEID
jgi:hypothetical protein